MKTARAVVINDDPKEALPMLQALGQVGIGAVYIAGDNVDHFPKKPISGIRVVFLDLNLNGRQEAKDYIPYTVKVLQTVVKCEPRTTGIVVWTKHSDEIQTLLKLLADAHITPAYVKAFEDKALITAGGNAARKLLTQLTGVLEEDPSRHLLFEWEQTVHDAATKAVDSLFAMSKDSDDLTRLLAAIAQAMAEDRIANPMDALVALGAGLVSVHADSVEDFEYPPPSKERDSRAVLLDMIANLRKNKPNLSQRALLNSFLLTTSSPALRPGNVYETALCKIPGIAPGEYARNFLLEVYTPNFKSKPVWKQFLDDKSNVLIPACIEITPSCDHAAGKTDITRLLLGLLIKVDDAAIPDEILKIPAECRLFAKDIEPIWLNFAESNIKDNYKLVVSARRFLTMPVEEMKKHKALFRFRHPVVTDIQSWFASHAGRPGYASVR